MSRDARPYVPVVVGKIVKTSRIMKSIGPVCLVDIQNIIVRWFARDHKIFSITTDNINVTWTVISRSRTVMISKRINVQLPIPI